MFGDVSSSPGVNKLDIKSYQVLMYVHFDARNAIIFSS